MKRYSYNKPLAEDLKPKATGAYMAVGAANANAAGAKSALEATEGEKYFASVSGRYKHRGKQKPTPCEEHAA